MPHKLTMFVDTQQSARQIEILEMNLDERPAASTFQLEFPAPLQMIDSGKRIVYEPRKVWSLMGVQAAVIGRSEKFAPSTFGSEAPVMQGERTPGIALSTGLLAAGGLVLGGVVGRVCWVFVKKARRP